MSLEDELARLERQVLGVARISRFAAAVDELRRMLAAESPALRRAVLKLTAPSIGRDLAAAVSAAFDVGILEASRLVDERPAKLPKIAPKALVTAARDAERRIMAELAKARKLAKAGADPEAVLGPVNAARLSLERTVTSLVNQAGNAGSTAVADAVDLPTVWVAETNACVTCLAYSGQIADPGESFPAGLTYGKRSTVSSPVKHPPAHPHCRCTVEPLNAVEYAEALRREADRSVLRGFSLESESMPTRIDAARRLVEKGVDAPASVVAYARRSVKAGTFSTRDRPPKPPPKPNPTGKDYRNMSNAEKVEAARRMYGTGSKQHRDAQKRWGRS